MRRQGNYSLVGAIVLCASVGVSWAADDPPPAGALQAAIESPASSQAKPGCQPDARITHSHVAVVDLAKVLERCGDYHARHGKLSDEIRHAEEASKAGQAEQQQREMKLAAMSSDDPEYDALAEQVATEGARLKTRIERDKIRFQKLEDNLRREAYRKAKQAIEQYAQARDVRLVLQIATLKDEANPSAIQALVTKPVLCGGAIDITEAIGRAVNEPVNDASAPGAEQIFADKESVTTMHGTPFATIDISRIFSVNERFQQENEELRADIAEAEKGLTDQRSKLAQLSRTLEGLPDQSDAYRRMQTTVMEHEAALKVLVNRQRQIFQRQEAEMYLRTFRAIQHAVTEEAARRGLELVLQFNGEPPDLGTHEGLTAELTKIVLYQRGIDITDEIIQALHTPDGSKSRTEQTKAAAKSAIGDDRPSFATFDLSRAMMENPGFRRACEQLKDDVAGAEKSLVAQRAELQDDADRLQQLDRDSAEFREGQRKITEQEAGMRESVNRQKLTFGQREAGIYLAAYREIERSAADVAAEKSLLFVLQFRDQPNDTDTAMGIKAELTQLVLYQRGADITDQVVERVARRAKDAH